MWGGAPRALEPLYADDDVLDEAVAYWSRRGFPYRDVPLYQAMLDLNKLAQMPDEQLLGTDVGYHLADSYHGHRFQASAAGMRSPLEAFADDKLLRRALGLLLTYGQPLTSTSLAGKLAIVSGTQACSNFRPGFALAVYRQFGSHGMRVLDTSSGYGGRLVGWMASGLGGRYVGIDPSRASCTSNETMAMDLGFAGNVGQLRAPAEDVPVVAVMAAAGGPVDLCFTSPPYFTKERYAAGHADEADQSWRRWPDAINWRAYFLRPMLRLQYAALRSGGLSVVNVADVQLGAKVYPLTEWLVDAAETAGFVQEDHDWQLRLSKRFGANQDAATASEPLYVFRKP